MIDGVVVTPLRQFADERGKVMHMLRADADHFVSFGEIYFSAVYPGAIKGWHLQREQILNYAVPHGNIKFVLYDDRPGSRTHGEVNEFFLGPDNYSLVTVPTMIWSGFKGIGTETAIVANCGSTPHNPDTADRKPFDDPAIPYDWAIKHR